MRGTKNGGRSDNGYTMTKMSEKPWTCNTRGLVGWSNGTHAWSIVLNNNSSVSVGICKENIHETDCEKNNDKRIDIYCANGDVVVKDEVHKERFLPGPLKKNDVVTFLLDMDNRKLYAALNGYWQKSPVIENIPYGTWFPYICIEKKGCSVSIIYAESQK